MQRAVQALNRVMLWAGSVVLLGTMGIAVANMVLRPLRMPIQGSFELLGFGGALIAAFALGPAQERRNHIAVDILFERFPAGVQRVCEGISHLACAVFFGLVGYRLVLLGFELRRAGELSETLQVAFYPVVWLTALGTAVLVLTLLLDAWLAWLPSEGRR